MITTFSSFFSDYFLSAYPDVKALDDLQQVSDDYSILGEFQNINTVTSRNSTINGYGFPNCKTKGAIKNWMNKHNESHSDGVHYHNFVITKALKSKSYYSYIHPIGFSTDIFAHNYFQRTAYHIMEPLPKFVTIPLFIHLPLNPMFAYAVKYRTVNSKQYVLQPALMIRLLAYATFAINTQIYALVFLSK